MTDTLSRFAFVDATVAAEALHVSPDTVLDWIKEGRLKTYGGRPSNPFLRSRDVAELAQSLGLPADAEPARRTRSASARVQTRLTADSRWSEIGEQELREWASRVDAARRQAARVVIAGAGQRLDMLARILDEIEGRTGG